MGPRKVFQPSIFVCPIMGCQKACKSVGGLKKHLDTVHPGFQPDLAGPLAQPRRQPPAQSPLPEPECSPEPQEADDQADDHLGSPPPPVHDNDPDMPYNLDDMSPGLCPSPSPSPSPPLGPPSPPPPAPPNPPPAGLQVHFHPRLDGTPCDINGYDLPPNTPPPPLEECAMDDYSPYTSRAEFEFAEFIFSEQQMSGKGLDKHLNNLAALYPNHPPPFADHQEMYSVIDATQEGDLPCQSFSVTYDGDMPVDAPEWMTATYDVWFRDPLLTMEQQIGNPDFAKEFDFAPKRIFKDDKRQYTDLNSGNWAWEQAVWLMFNSIF